MIHLVSRLQCVYFVHFSRSSLVMRDEKMQKEEEKVIRIIGLQKKRLRTKTRKS